MKPQSAIQFYYKDTQTGKPMNLPFEEEWLDIIKKIDHPMSYRNDNEIENYGDKHGR